MADLKYIGKNILNHDLILKKGDVSGSNSSTGSFGNINISKNASVTGDMVVGGTLTAQEIHTEIESASIIFTSGSTKFGDTQDDIHSFTGSLKITGSVTALNLTADSASFSTRITTNSSSFATRITDFSTGNVELISGSSTSTGSFGRVEAEHIHSTDDITVADDLTVEGLIVASGNEIRGSYPLNKLTFPATQRAAINDVFFIHSSGGRGSLQLVGNTNRVGSNTLFGFSRDDINEFKSDHASVTYKNFIMEADAVIAFPGSSGPTQAQDLSIFKSNVTTTVDHGFGRRLFLDFRRDDNAMFTADMSGSIYAFGNISGSLTSTGSFGSVMQNGKHFPQTNAPGENIAFGTDAGSAFVGGNVNKINIAIGLSAGSAMADYGGNVFIGKNAAKLRTRGDDNVVIGTSAGGTDGDDFGDKNVFIGLSTGLNINSTNSDSNVFIGNLAGTAGQQSIANVLIGDQAGKTLTNSSRNVAIGVFAGTGFGVTAATTENSVYIGQYARTSATDANNEIVIGSEAVGHGTDTITFGDGQITDVYFASGSSTGATFHGIKDFAGNISGSATSTGSFGMGYFNQLGILNKNPSIQTSDADDLVIGDGASGVNRGITIHTSAGNSFGSIRFSDGTSGSSRRRGEIKYDHADDTLTLAAQATEVLEITSGGGLEVLTGNISGSSTSTGSFGKLEVGSQIRLIEGSDSFIKGGDLGIGTNTPVARLEIEDDGTSNAMLLKLTQDNNSVYGMVVGNDTFSTNDTEGGQHILGNDGTYIIRSLGTSTAARIGAGLAFNNYKYLEIDFDTDTAEFTTTNISGSATSTGSFGLVLQNGSELSTFLGAAGTEPLFSGSAVSTASFGRAEIDGTGTFDKIGINVSNPSEALEINAGKLKFSGHASGFGAGMVGMTSNTLVLVGGSNGININGDSNGLDKNGFTFTAAKVSGSSISTGSFGRLEIGEAIIDNDNISATSFTGIFQGALSGSAQIASNISGAFAVASASFAADILSNSSSLSTRITTNSSSFAARDTLSEATSSKILNGELEFTNITASNNISASGDLSVGGVAIFNGHITASGAVNLDGKVFIQTGSLEGDLLVSTNENLMRIGKSTSGVIVSGSGTVSRFATGSDGSIIDLGFTTVDEDGNVVLAGDGDGIHVDDNNYWYNNKFYKIGDGVDKFLEFDNIDLKYKGQVFAQTGSIDGELHIVSPTGSMFIGKYTGGIPSSGSANVSRFATGSDGSIIDLGFTTTNEDGETVFLSTGDGIVVDDKNYWYTSGHFKIGNENNFINWDTTNLNISGTFTGDGSGLTGITSTTFTTMTSSGDVLFQSDLKVDGTLTAQEIHTEIESASIIFTSGSTMFGDDTGDTHRFTGSLSTSGSLKVVGEALIGSGSHVAAPGITSGQVDLLVRPNVLVGDYTTRLVVEQPKSHTYKSDAEIHVHGYNDGRLYIGGNRQRKIIFKTNASSLSSAESWTIGTPDDSTDFQISALNSTVQALLIDKNSGDITAVGNISSSASSTGSFGTIRTATTVGSLSSGIVLGDGDSGIYEASDDAVVITAGNSVESFRVNATTIRARTNEFKINTTDNTTYGINLDTDNSANKISLIGSGVQTINMSKYGKFETTTTQNTSAPNFLYTGTFDQIGSFSATAQFVKLNPTVDSSNAVATSSFTTLDLAGTIDMSGQTQETIRGIHIHPTKTGVGNYTAIDADGDIVISGNVSGSSDSTGSFGQVNIVGNINIEQTGSMRELEVKKIIPHPTDLEDFPENKIDFEQPLTITGNNKLTLKSSGDTSTIEVDQKNIIFTPQFRVRKEGLSAPSYFSVISASANCDGLAISGSGETTASFGIVENNTPIAGYRPILNKINDFSASLSNAGRYHIVHGELTCSIGLDSHASASMVGSEYEFFQSSSVGKFLFQTGSGVTLLSKNNNVNLAGQHSGATLKKVATNTYHLVGDLT